jgi:hypothetical protein
VFKNRLLRGIFGLRKGEVTASWKDLHNEKFHNLYLLPIAIRVMKSRKMRQMAVVIRKRRNGYKFSVEKSEGKWQLGKLWEDGSIILKSILKNDMMFRLRTRTLIDVCINLIMGGFVS